MDESGGRRVSLTWAQRWAGDLAHFARQVPTVPMLARLNVAPLLAARAACRPAPGWEAIFVRALALVAADRPELRRSYVSFPRPHLYEHPISVAALAVERWAGSTRALFLGHIRGPESLPLLALEHHVRRFGQAPVETIGRFRRAMRMGGLPGPIRRLAWWRDLHASGYRRARRFGTFAVTSQAYLGSESVHPASIWTLALDHGVIQANGDVNLRLVYDHRVLDGGPVARTLADLERVLNTTIRTEVEELHPSPIRPDVENLHPSFSREPKASATIALASGSRLNGRPSNEVRACLNLLGEP